MGLLWPPPRPVAVACTPPTCRHSDPNIDVRDPCPLLAALPVPLSSRPAGEVVVTYAGRVLWFNEEPHSASVSSGLTGSLFVTNFRLVFLNTERSSYDLVRDGGLPRGVLGMLSRVTLWVVCPRAQRRRQLQLARVLSQSLVPEPAWFTQSLVASARCLIATAPLQDMHPDSALASDHDIPLTLIQGLYAGLKAQWGW